MHAVALAPRGSDRGDLRVCQAGDAVYRNGIGCTRMETATTSDSLEIGNFSAVHFNISGTPLCRTPHQAANLMPGESVILTSERACTILINGGSVTFGPPEHFLQEVC